MERSLTPIFEPELVDKHLDAVLRASGSALRHYSTQKALDEMRGAMRAAMAEAVQKAFSDASDLV